MPLDTPFRLGQFLVDRQGRLLPGTPDATPTLHLHWRGLAICIRLVTTAPGDDAAGEGGAGEGGRIAMSAVVGRVPSTAADVPGAASRRARALASLDALSAVIGDGWRVRLLPDHRASIEAARAIALPATARALLIGVTCFLLDLAPYLDLMADSDFAVEAAGIVNT